MILSPNVRTYIVILVYNALPVQSSVTGFDCDCSYRGLWERKKYVTVVCYTVHEEKSKKGNY